MHKNTAENLKPDNLGEKRVKMEKEKSINSAAW